MRVAHHYRQPLSVIRGRAPAGDPVWLPDDLDAALAFEQWLLEDRAVRCPRCGTRPDDWRDERGRPRRNPPWVARTDDCYGCKMVADNRPDSKDDGVKGGWRNTRLVPYDDTADDPDDT